MNDYQIMNKYFRKEFLITLAAFIVIAKDEKEAKRIAEKDLKNSDFHVSIHYLQEL